MGLLDTMAESQEHYKVVIEAAEKSGIFTKFPLSKHDASQKYFNEYIRPHNDSIMSQKELNHTQKVQDFVLMEDVIQ